MINFKKNSYMTVKNILSEDAQWEGNLSFTSNVKIDGKGKGNITCTADVMVGEGADIVGDITAENVIISGKIEGNVTVTGQFCLTATGHLKGNVKAASVLMEDGAFFAGISESTMRPEEGDTAENLGEENAVSEETAQELAPALPADDEDDEDKIEIQAYVKGRK